MSSLNTPDCPIKYFSCIVKACVKANFRVTRKHCLPAILPGEVLLLPRTSTHNRIFYSQGSSFPYPNKKGFPHSIFTHCTGSFLYIYKALSISLCVQTLNKPVKASLAFFGPLYTPASSSTCMNTSPISFWMMLWIFSAFTS